MSLWHHPKREKERQILDYLPEKHVKACTLQLDRLRVDQNVSPHSVQAGEEGIHASGARKAGMSIFSDLLQSLV